MNLKLEVHYILSLKFILQYDSQDYFKEYDQLLDRMKLEEDKMETSNAGIKSTQSGEQNRRQKITVPKIRQRRKYRNVLEEIRPKLTMTQRDIREMVTDEETPRNPCKKINFGCLS